MTLTKDPYYEKGVTIEDFMVSQSSLKEIDPARNGSPRKFKSYFVDQRDKPSTAMLRGSIFHLYSEDKDVFKLSDDVAPGGILGEVADAIQQKYLTLDEQSQQEMMLMLDTHILGACRAVGWNKSWGDAAIIKNAQPVKGYLEAVNHPDNVGKIILTSVLKEQIEKCIESLSKNDFAHALLFWKDEFSNVDYYKELAIFWEEKIDNRLIQCKAKLDDLIIDHEKEVIKLTDLKTTGTSAHNFEPTFKAYRLDLQFNMYERAVKAYFPEFAHYKFEFRNVVVETQGQFETVVHRWSKNIISAASFDLDQLFRRVIKAKDTGFEQSVEEQLGKGEVMHKELAA